MKTDNPDEIDLLKRLQLGDMRAFETLFLRYQPQLVLFIDGFIKDEEKARDFSQDIFVKIWTSRSRMTDIQSFKGYLFQTARFAIYNYFDHQLVDRKFISEVLHQSADETYDAEEEYFAKELNSMIDLAISRMPEQRRKVFVMSRKQGMSNQQIADTLHISKHTVERHISNSLIEIRKLKRLMIFLFLI